MREIREREKAAVCLFRKNKPKPRSLEFVLRFTVLITLLFFLFNHFWRGVAVAVADGLVVGVLMERAVATSLRVMAPFCILLRAGSGALFHGPLLCLYCCLRLSIASGCAYPRVRAVMYFDANAHIRTPRRAHAGAAHQSPQGRGLPGSDSFGLWSFLIPGKGR